MTTIDKFTAYEISLNIRPEWQAHSLSNSGTNGSIRTLPRRQLLANGTEVDAVSGNIAKRHHAMLLAEYFEETGVSLCPACMRRDGRRAAALINHPDYEDMDMRKILSQCGVCDAHGFLVTAKKPSGSDTAEEARQRLSKHSLIEFPFGLALPDTQAETTQLFTRAGAGDGDGQMLMKRSVRSASYGICIRYKCAGIGVDTDTWKVVINDKEERIKRHRAILCALRDCVLSPDGAQTSTTLPHLTNLKGAIVVQLSVGRAPILSPLVSDFVTRLAAMENEARVVLTFESVDEFSGEMDNLIEKSEPHLPGSKNNGVSSQESSSEHKVSQE
jgi:CRISPR-associated autoregulator DevR family